MFSKFRTLIIGFGLVLFIGSNALAQDVKFEKTYTDSSGQLQKVVLLPDGSQPLHETQDWIAIEFPIDVQEQPLANFLPNLIFKKKMSVNRVASEIEKILNQGRLKNQLQPLAVTNNPLWPLKKDHWDFADEILFDEWIQQNAKTDILAGSGLLVDCADFSLALRWIFAFENGLPAAQSLAGSGQLFGSWQSTTEWDKLATDTDWRKNQKLKAALRYMFNVTYTHSLQNDLYPVEISRDYVRPGGIFLTISGGTGHAQTIFKLGPNVDTCPSFACISVIWGNEPASESGFVSMVYSNFISEGHGGFLRYRWPEKTGNQWNLRRAADMPGFSKEQFTWNNVNYMVNLNDKLQLWGSLSEQATAMTASLEQAFLSRKRFVELGFYICSVLPCDPKSAFYDTYSTPTRDHDIGSFISSVQGFVSQLDPNSSEYQQMQQELITTVYSSAPSPSFWDLSTGSNWSRLSSDPTKDIFARWGFAPLSQKDQIRILASVMSDNWSSRSQLVQTALWYCMQHDPCDPSSPIVQAFGTERLDDAFRAEKKILVQRIRAQSPADQQELENDLNSFDSFGYNIWSLLMVEDTFQKMTSNPTDTYEQRMGL